MLSGLSQVVNQIVNNDNCTEEEVLALISGIHTRKLETLAISLQRLQSSSEREPRGFRECSKVKSLFSFFIII